MPNRFLHSRVWGRWHHLPVCLLRWLQQHGIGDFLTGGDGAGDAGRQSSLKPTVKVSSGTPHVFYTLCSCPVTVCDSTAVQWRILSRVGRLPGLSGLPAKSSRFPESVTEQPKVKKKKIQRKLYIWSQRKRLWFKTQRMSVE